MQTLIFTDLDDTLFQTHRKCQDPSSSLVATLSKELLPSSYMSKKQQQLFKRLEIGSCCVPVTARNITSFERVKLKFNGPAILSYGATILNTDRTIAANWNTRMKDIIDNAQSTLHQLHSMILSQKCVKVNDLQVKLIKDPVGVVYIRVKQQHRDSTQLRKLWQYLTYTRAAFPALNEHFQVQQNDNTLVFLPIGISKAAAVKYLIHEYEKTTEVLSIGLGDSDSDTAYMQLCDYWMTPSNSQISVRL